MSETVEQPVNQETEDRIGRVADTIASAEWQRFTGFQESIGENGPVDPDAAAVFVDKDKPEGQQEVKVPMQQLTEAYDRITSGEYDYDKSVYSFKVGGQQRTMSGDRVFGLMNNIFIWKLEPFKQGLAKMKAWWGK